MCWLLGRGKSDRYKLNCVGDITPTCGAPVLKVWVLDVLLLYEVYPCLPFIFCYIKGSRVRKTY